MAVVVYTKACNDLLTALGQIVQVDATRFLHVWADSGTLKGRIGTVDATSGVVTFGADQTLLTIPNYGSPGYGRPGLCKLAALSTTQAAIQWTDGYRTYYFTPLTLNLSTGSITAGTTQNTFGTSGSQVPDLFNSEGPTGFCKYDATHYCAVIRQDGFALFGVMDATCVVVGTPISVTHGSPTLAKNVVAMDAALTQFLPFIIDDTGGATDDPYVDMVTPGTPPVRNNTGVNVHAGGDASSHRVTSLIHVDDTHSVYLMQPSSTTLRLVTVTENGGTHTISSAQDALVIMLPGTTSAVYPGSSTTAYPGKFDAVMIDSTHLVIVGTHLYAPTETDDQFGRYICRTYYWTLEWDGANWTLVAPPILKDLDAAVIQQNNVNDYHVIAMGTSGITVTMWKQAISPGGAGSPNRLAVYSPYFDVLAPPRSVTPAAALRTAHVFGPRVLDPTAATGQLTAELYRRAAPTVKVATL